MTAQAPSARQIRIAILLTAALQLAVLVLQAVTSEMRGYDFNALYAAGQILNEGGGPQLYDIDRQAHAESTILNRPDLVSMAHPITHPPFEAFLFAPLARLPYAAAYLVWGGVNILLWMVFAYVSRPFAPVPHQAFQYILLCFAFLPTWSTMVYGQTTLLLLLLYSLTYISLKRQQDLRAGAFLALGLFKFQLVLPFAAICLLRRKWRMMAGFAAVGLLLGGLSVLAVGVSGLVAYGTFLVKLVQQPANPGFIPILPRYMPTLRGLLTVLLTGHVSSKWVTGGVALISASLILATGICWRRKDRLEGNASLGLIFSSALTVTMLTAFHLYVYDLALVPLAVLLAIGSPRSSCKTPWRTLLYVSIVVLYLPPVYMLAAQWDKRYLLCLPVCALALALFGLLRQQAGTGREVPLAGSSGVSANGKEV